MLQGLRQREKALGFKDWDSEHANYVFGLGMLRSMGSMQDDEDPATRPPQMKRQADHLLQHEHFSPDILEKLKPPTINKVKFSLTLDYNHVRFVGKTYAVDGKTRLPERSRVFGEGRPYTARDALIYVHSFLWDSFHKDSQV